MPILSDVFESAVVGPGFRLQQIPRAVTGAEAPLDTLPTDHALYCVIVLATLVVSVGVVVLAESIIGGPESTDFLQEINPITRKAGNKNISLIKENKEALGRGVIFFMLAILEGLGGVLSNLFRPCSFTTCLRARKPLF